MLVAGKCGICSLAFPPQRGILLEQCSIHIFKVFERDALALACTNGIPFMFLSFGA